MLTPNEANRIANPNRPLFNRPKWAKSNKDPQNDLFHRSNRAYDHLPEDDDDLKKARSRSSSKAAASRSTATAHEPNSPNLVKTDNKDDVNIDALTADATAGTDPVSSQNVIPTARDSAELDSTQLPKLVAPPSLVGTYTNDAKILSKKRGYEPEPAAVIDLDDATDVAHCPEAKSSAKAGKSRPCVEKDALTIENSIEDEEFPELARKAREDARRKRLQQDFSLSNENDIWQGSPEEVPNSRTESAQDTPKHTAEYTVNILVTSKIEGTKPLIVTRKLSQRLKDVRLAWIQCQAVPKDTLDCCFLTWRGRRVFDSTSCKGLGLAVDEAGSLRSLSDKQSFDDGRIHLEIMTPEMFEAYKKAKEQSANVSVDNDDSYDAPTKLPEIDVPQIRIVLRAKNFSEFRLKVKPTTSISKIVNAFRQSNTIDLDKEVFLSFDGERLQAGSMIQETEIADMDHIEVYVR